MMATTTKQTKRGSRVRATRQPLGLVSANTPPKKQQKHYSSISEPTFLPPKYISNTNVDTKENQDDDDEPSIGSMSSTSSRFSYRGIKRIFSVGKSKSMKGVSTVNDQQRKEKASQDDAFVQEELDIRSGQPNFVPPKYIYTPPKKELSSKVRTPEHSFIPPKYIATTTSANVNEKQEDDEPSIGSFSSMSSTASQYSYRGIKRTVSVKPRKKRALVHKFLNRKSRSKKKQGTLAGSDRVLQEESAVRDAYMQEGLEIRSDEPTFVPPKFIYTPPKNELLIKASTPELSFVSPKYIATGPANLHQKLADDKTSINSIALISHRGIKYTLSLNDLIDCHYNYLVGKQAIVRSEHRSQTIHGKRMPRVLRLRLKRCTLDIDDVYRYKALKLCQRIIFRRIKVHNENRRKSIIQSISKKINIADPIRQSSIEMNEHSTYNVATQINTQ